MSLPSYLHIDPTVLLTVTGNDRAACRALSQTFLDVTPAMFARLLQALAAGDRKAAAHASHALRGNTALIGAVELGAILLAIERPPADGSAPGAPDIDALQWLMAQVMREVGASMADGQAGAAAGHD